MTQKELNKVVENHSHWIKEDCDGCKNMRANLSGADLRGLNLDYALLDYALLDHASLDHASLNGASLNGASLNGASLNYASLNHALLDGASLDGASLRDASLNGVKNLFVPLRCPSEGSFVGWKRVDKHIVKLLIPSEAKRSSATTEKCRCEYAEVLEIQKKDGTDSGLKTIHNHNYAGAEYTVGEIVRPDSFDENRWNECSHGIHFFVDRESAVRY